MNISLICVNEPFRSRLTLRKEGQEGSRGRRLTQLGAAGYCEICRPCQRDSVAGKDANFSLSLRQYQNDLRDQIDRELVNRGFQLDKRSQYFSGTHDEMLSVATRVSAKHRSPIGNVIETHEHKGDFKEW